MGFFENIRAAHPVSRELAKIVRILSSDHKIESDLDLHVTALNNLCSVDGWTIHSVAKINVPFIVEPIERNPIRVALFNELHVNAFSAASKEIIKQYDDNIALFLKESHDLLIDKQIVGYFAAIISENKDSETPGYYPKGGKFEYYYSAEPNGRSFRIIGETFAGL